MIKIKQVSKFLKQCSQNVNKTKQKTGWRLYPISRQHSTAVPSGLNQTGKRISWDTQKGTVKISHRLHSQPQGIEVRGFLNASSFGRSTISMNEEDAAPQTCLIKYSVLNIIALHFKSLYLLDFLNHIDPFHILNLAVTKYVNRVVYTIKAY